MTKRKTTPHEKVGRPTTYTPEIITRICDQIADGRSLRKVCEDDGMPSKMTVLNWLNRYPEFVTQYARAKDESADSHADDMLDIADEAIERTDSGAYDAAQVAHQRLRIDARKWIASKLKPKKYGERVHTEVSGTMSLEQIVATTGLKESPEQQP